MFVAFTDQLLNEYGVQWDILVHMGFPGTSYGVQLILILHQCWTSVCTHLLLFYKYWLIIMFEISRSGLAQFFHVLSFLALDLVMCAVRSYITHTVKKSLLILYYHRLCCVSCLRLRNATIGFAIPRARVISRSICFNSILALNYKHDCWYCNI